MWIIISLIVYVECRETTLYKTHTISNKSQTSIAFTDIKGINKDNCLNMLFLITQLNNMEHCVEESTFPADSPYFSSKGSCKFSYGNGVVDIFFNNVFDSSDPTNNGETSLEFSDEFYSYFSNWDDNPFQDSTSSFVW